MIIGMVSCFTPQRKKWIHFSPKNGLGIKFQSVGKKNLSRNRINGKKSKRGTLVKIERLFKGKKSIALICISGAEKAFRFFISKGNELFGNNQPIQTIKFFKRARDGEKNRPINRGSKNLKGTP